MSDILIRGMELPKNEPLRIVLNPNGQLFVDHGVTFTEYEAVELPEHGDLIDRSELKTNMIDDTFGSAACYVNLVQILDAPVIVPADKEKTP